MMTEGTWENPETPPSLGGNSCSTGVPALIFAEPQPLVKLALQWYSVNHPSLLSLRRSFQPGLNMAKHQIEKGGCRGHEGLRSGA